MIPRCFLKMSIQYPVAACRCRGARSWMKQGNVLRQPRRPRGRDDQGSERPEPIIWDRRAISAAASLVPHSRQQSKPSHARASETSFSAAAVWHSVSSTFVRRRWELITVHGCGGVSASVRGVTRRITIELPRRCLRQRPTSESPRGRLYGPGRPATFSRGRPP
jgi:hypothetical protein